jgi:hypothetical protein
VLISDVHPEHHYSEMSIPTAAERVSIQTYKHPISDVRETIKATGFEMIRFEQFGLIDLAWKPPTENFSNIYDDPRRPIFYMCWLRRT